MFAIIYLIAGTLSGRWIRKEFLAGHKLLDKAPAFVLVAADFYLGIIPLTTLNYFLALLVNPLLPAKIYPLLISNIICLAGFVLLPGRSYVHKFKKRKLLPAIPGWFLSIEEKLRRSPYKTLFYGGSIVIFAAWAGLLTSHVLRSEGGYLGAGFSVFSDYAPHTAVVSSFAKGRNFPTDYPHFARDGVQYHFFFYFLAGNLEYLGLDTASALNLPSALGMIAFCVLLGYIAVLWTRRDAAFLLAPMLLYLRSSNAIWYWLRDLPKLAAESGVSVITYIRRNDIFIGRLPMDDWGLWNLNVFANQRHFLFAMGAALLILIILYPSLGKPSIRSWIDPGAWLSASRREYLPVFILLACLPYWHGSVTVALLLMMALIAVFSRDKLIYLVSAMIALGFAFIYGKAFSGESGNGIGLSYQWGFIAPDKTVFGVFSYLWELLGLALPAILILPFLQANPRKRVLAASATLPLIFALTVSLTPDITVNHKYVMISQMLATILLADLILRLWRLPSARFPARLTAVMLTIVLTLTGVVDLISYRNKNKNLFYIPESSAFQTWIETNTEEKAVFLTPPWHYHPFFLTGRQVWYGHSYYAWSAGHDTATRDDEVRQLFAGTNNDPYIFIDYCMQNRIQYAIISDDLRTNPDFVLNEAFFRDNFEIAASFPEQNNAVIYRIYE